MTLPIRDGRKDARQDLAAAPPAGQAAVDEMIIGETLVGDQGAVLEAGGDLEEIEAAGLRQRCAGVPFGRIGIDEGVEAGGNEVSGGIGHAVGDQREVGQAGCGRRGPHGGDEGRRVSEMSVALTTTTRFWLRMAAHEPIAPMAASASERWRSGSGVVSFHQRQPNSNSLVATPANTSASRPWVPSAFFR